MIRSKLVFEVAFFAVPDAPQMLSIPFNPYTWDDRADKVSSNIVSLQLKDNMGTPVVVEDLKSMIDIVITRKLEVKNNIFGGQSFFIKPSMDDEMQYHVVNVDIDRSSMKITVSNS